MYAPGRCHIGNIINFDALFHQHFISRIVIRGGMTYREFKFSR